MDFTQLIKGTCLVFFGLCFFAQVWDQVKKFFEKDSTMVFITKPDPKLTFPTLAFCPNKGFKTKV